MIVESLAGRTWVALTGKVRAAGRGLDGLVFCLTLLLLLWLPLPFGSHRPWAEYSFVAVTLALWSLSCLALCLSQRIPSFPDRRWTTVFAAALWLLWLAWLYAQTLQWPASWVAAMSPLRFEQARSVAYIFGSPPPASLTPSLDGALSRGQVLLSAAYGALFLLIATGLRERKHFRWLLWLLVLSGIAQALYGSVMVLSGLEYGPWGAKQTHRGFATGTFANRNHFAGYLEICLGAAVGLIVARPIRRTTRRGWRQHLRHWLGLLQDSRVFARAAVGEFFIALILSQSRMGNVAAVGALCAAGLALLLTRRRSGILAGLLLIGSVLVIDIWLFGRWFGADQLAERYATLGVDATTRLDVLADIWRMIPVYGWIGSGLGTFMLAYPAFRSAEIQGFVDHAHNDYAQFLIETGVIGVAILGCLVLSTVVRAILILRRRRDPLSQGVAAAALTAMSAIAIHSAADFNLQIPANAAALTALMGAVWACSTVSSRQRIGAERMNVE